MKTEEKKELEKAFKEYCKFSKWHINNKFRFKFIFRQLKSESQKYLSIRSPLGGFGVCEFDYIESLGWELFAVSRGFLYDSIIFKRKLKERELYKNSIPKSKIKDVRYR